MGGLPGAGRRRRQHGPSAQLCSSAVDEGVIAGSVTLELESRIGPGPSEPLAPDEAHVRMLGVAPEHRGRGIARRLMLASIEAARSHGKRLLTLDTDPVMTAAQHLYVELGFEPTEPSGQTRRAGAPELRTRHRLRVEAETLGSIRARRLREGREGAPGHQALRASVRDRGGLDDEAARRGARGERSHRPALCGDAARQRRHRRRGERPVAGGSARAVCSRPCSWTTTRPLSSSWPYACSSRCAPSRIPRSSARSPTCPAP